MKHYSAMPPNDAKIQIMREMLLLLAKNQEVILQHLADHNTSLSYLVEHDKYSVAHSRDFELRSASLAKIAKQLERL